MQSRLPASQKMLLISDVHLGAFSDEENRRLERELIVLLDFADENDFAIAVLGDLFDYWIEYPGFVPSLGEKLLKRFKKFNEQNGRTIYITGNHDNWTLGHFADCGFDVEPDYRILHINNRKVLLLHGDATGKDPDHLQRPAVHRLLRNATFLKVYRSLLPPAAGLWLMRQVSKWSGVLGQKKDDPAVLNKWAEKLLNEHDIDVIICGHDHTPRCLQYRFGSYLNLGTFYEHRSMAVYNKGKFKLVTWNRSEQSLTPITNTVDQR